MTIKGEWEKHVDEASGLAYYFNAQTGESSWEIPAGFESPQALNASQDGKTRKWREYVDDASGATYYHDEVTGVSRWDKPEDFVPPENKKETLTNNQEITNSENEEIEELRKETQVREHETRGEIGKEKVEHKHKAGQSLSGGVWKERKEVAKESIEGVSAAASSWTKYVDPTSNKPCFYNASTGQTQWEKPKDFNELTQETGQSTNPQVSAEYQAHLNRMRTERLARVTQQVLDPSGNLSKLNAILSDIDRKAPPISSSPDDEVSDASRPEKAEWQQHVDAQTQRYYYHNVVTGVTQWAKPDAPIVSGLASWIPPENPDSDLTGKDDKIVSGVDYIARAKFNRLTGKYEQLGGDEYWQKAGMASDRAGRQMSHFFDVSELEKNREEARRRKEQLKRKNIDWKKIAAEKKAKKQKQKNEWLYTV